MLKGRRMQHHVHAREQTFQALRIAHVTKGKTEFALELLLQGKESAFIIVYAQHFRVLRKPGQSL